MSRIEEHAFTENKLNGMSKAQRLFILEYSLSGNLKKAAEAAGYSESYAKRLLDNKRIAAVIAENSECEEEKLKKRIIDEWASIAFADIGKYIDFSSDEDGRAVIGLRDSSLCGDTSAICELSQAANGTFKLKLYDKQTALLQLSKLMGFDVSGGCEEKGEKSINIEMKGEVKDWIK